MWIKTVKILKFSFFKSVPHPPDNDPNKIDAGNRVGGFEMTDYHIFDKRPLRPVENNFITNGGGFGKGGGGGGSNTYYRPDRKIFNQYIN